MEQQVQDPVPRVVDHVGFAVADYQRSKAFYEKSLAPLGLTLLMEFSGAAAGFGRSGRPSFFIEAHGEPVRGRLHVALRADTRAQVDAFHAAAIEEAGPTMVRPASGRPITPTITALRPRPRRQQHRGCVPRARVRTSPVPVLANALRRRLSR
jgi:hypothetical protein